MWMHERYPNMKFKAEEVRHLGENMLCLSYQGNGFLHRIYIGTEEQAKAKGWVKVK